MDERLKQEIEYWSVDQFDGDLKARHTLNLRHWDAIAPMLVHPLPPGPFCVVGCGHGGIEQKVAQVCGRGVYAVDIIEPKPRPPLWDTFEKEWPIGYYPGVDAQRSLPFEGYGAVFCAMVVHHFPDLEGFAATCLRHLAPGGWLVLHEYVGLPGLHASEKRYRLAQRLWCSLPIKYRLREDGTEQEHVRVVPDGEAEGYEAVRSDEIRPVLLGAGFEVVAERFSAPLTGYRTIVWGEHGIRRLNPDVDRVVDALESILMASGVLNGEVWTAVLRKPSEA